jgi:carbamoyltransferase
MAVILGINAFHAGAAAALVVDGEPVAAIAEERLNRVKYYAGFPSLAISACLDIAGLDFSEIDAVAIGRDPAANRMQKIRYSLTHPSMLSNLLKVRTARSDLDRVKTLIAKGCDVDPEKLRFDEYGIEHHIAHTASAYFISDWERSAGFTLDGSGDFVSCMMSECEGDQIHVRRRIFLPDSIGSLYMMVCEFIGYDRYGDEGKVMGLAPLGKDTYHDIFNEMIHRTRNGYRLNQAFFRPLGSHAGMSIDENGQMVVHRHYSDRVIELFGEPRDRHAEITPRDEDLAFGVQRIFEDFYLHVLNQLHDLVPDERVSMAGGCVLNSVANGMIFDETPFTQTCIQPAAGDDGLALGAALYVSNAILKEGKRFVMRDSYLGQEYSESEIRQALDSAGVSYVRHEREALLEDVVDEIVEGNVIGWFQGRMEWGPRALGNRSILAHPGFPGMKDILNSRIKHREAFRPFAPSILAERQAEVFEQGYPSPFMLHVYKIRSEWRDRLSAVNHVDNTGRLQSVAHDENPLYHDLISTFEQRTGIPILLNTSFNENEPIVMLPEEAIACFQRTKMDVLAIGPYVCKKKAD